VVVVKVSGNFPGSPANLTYRFWLRGGWSDQHAGGAMMSDSREFTGRRALVTGGTKGVGAAVAARLREAGATVLTTARTRPDRVAPGELFVAADITTAEGCMSVANAVADQLGGIDIIVHVAGGSSAPGGGFAVQDDSEWQRALDQNPFPAVRLDRALVPKMLDQGSGAIIHIACRLLRRRLCA
jgi:NAD(P)-dependent dehydrogenase (short-subunit alcohol dehydrogenase family)